MVEAEEEYLEQLQLMVSCFLRPFKMAASSQKPPCTHDEVNSIFLNAETVMFLHQIFLKGLTARMECWPTLVLGIYRRIIFTSTTIIIHNCPSSNYLLYKKENILSIFQVLPRKTGIHSILLNYIECMTHPTNYPFLNSILFFILDLKNQISFPNPVFVFLLWLNWYDMIWYMIVLYVSFGYLLLLTMLFCLFSQPMGFHIKLARKCSSQIVFI